MFWWCRLGVIAVIRNQGEAQSDVSQVLGVDDIFTRKDAISGLKSSLWAGLGNLVNIPLNSSILKYDITTFNIAFPIPYT